VDVRMRVQEMAPSIRSRKGSRLDCRGSTASHSHSGKKNSRAIRIQPLLDTSTAWTDLHNSHPLNTLQSEMYFNAAVKEWLKFSSRQSPSGRARLLQLAESLKQNHQELWLSESLNAAFSAEATALLMSSVNANYRGDHQRAIKDASAAAIRFKRLGNLPGATLSEYQIVYALRRQSKSMQCVFQVATLNRAL